jgi:hypothetical protein
MNKLSKDIQNKIKELDPYRNNWIIGGLKIDDNREQVAVYQIGDIINLFDNQSYKVKKGNGYTGNTKDLKRFLSLLKEIYYFQTGGEYKI